MIRERDIERLLVKRCKERGWLCWKFVSPGLRGVPDRIVINPYGFDSFIELKAPGERPTPAQLRCHETLRKFGCRVTVLDSKEAVEAWVRGA